MSKYLFINMLIIGIPLAFSFEREISYYKKFKNLFIVFVTVGIPFIIWDNLAVSRKDWIFNSQYVGKINIFSLPLEEVLFFMTVPFATIFLYEVLKRYIFEKDFNLPRIMFYLLSLIFIISGFILVHTPYTSSVLLVAGFTLFMSATCFFKMVNTIYYWMFLSVSFVLFLIFNIYFTGLPIIIYSDYAYLGYKILTMPVENIIYNYSLLTLSMGVYCLLDKNKNKKLK